MLYLLFCINPIYIILLNIQKISIPTILKGGTMLKQHKDFYPIILTLILLLVSFSVFFFFRGPINLWIPISMYALLDVGFIVSLVLGIKSKHPTVKMFSILANILCIIPVSIVLFLLLLANGISE